MADHEESPKKLLWPISWLRDEDFWKNITINVAGTGTVAFIVLVYANLAGYLDPTGDKAAYRIAMFFGGIGLTLVGVVMAWLNYTSAKEMERREGRAAFWRYFIGVGLLLLLMLSLVAVPFILGVINDGPIGAK